MSLNDIDTRPRRAICFTPMETDRSVIVNAAIHAERLGYEAIIVPEGWGFDSGILLTEIAMRTERIRLVAGIQSIWGRTPATLAMQAATLDDVSSGRFTLGLGASTSLLADGLHGVPFERPSARLSRTVEVVRSLLAGERAPSVDGSPGLRLGMTPRPHVPIWVAGLGPRSARLATQLTDGWFPALIPLSSVDRVIAGVALDASPTCEFVTGPMANVSADVDVSVAAARQLVGWYLTGMGRLYGDNVASLGHADAVDALRAANPRPRPGRIEWPTEADDLLDQLAAYGRPDDVAATLRAWDERVDLVSVLTGPTTTAALRELLEVCAPPNPVAVLSGGVSRWTADSVVGGS